MLELNKIYCMDCLDGLKLIPDNSIDLVLTDPPYGVEYYSGWYVKENPHDKIINDDKFFCPTETLWNKLKPTGGAFIFYSHKVPLEDPRIKNRIIWVKNNWSAGDLNGDFGNQYECIAFMPKENFKLRYYRYSNVWNFDRVSSDKLLHPTQKPLDLIRRIILCSTDVGDTVLDPFMGSGTTAVACKQLRRNFIGFELSQKYVDIANKRLSQETIFDYVLEGALCQQ